MPLRPTSVGMGLAVLLAGCEIKPVEVEDTAILEEEPVDLDGDGHVADEDCDDADAAAAPGLEEICDGVDNDCDGEIDEEASDALVWYADADGDGYGDSALPQDACEAPGGYVGDGTDCDDANPAVNPGAAEVCDDTSTDEDCDGLSDDADESLDPASASSWFPDTDLDGSGDPLLETVACLAPEGHVGNGDDCSDFDPDQNELDVDGDGESTCDGDCDDSEPGVSTLAEEIGGNQLDDDCDGIADELVPAAIGFDFKGIWDQEYDTLLPYVYPLGSTGTLNQVKEPVVRVTLASTDFFSVSSSDPLRDSMYCEFDASFDFQPSSFPLEEFDYTTGIGGSGVSVEAWAAYEGSLSIVGTSFSPRCTQLDPDTFEDGQPFALLDGMRFGVAMAPLSEFLETMLSGAYGATWPDYQPAYFTQYIAINHPDSAVPDGYSFTAYDWTSSFTVETDQEVCETAAMGTICGLLGIDWDNGVYILGDVSNEPHYGYIQGSPYWYEDFPNLDLDLLTEGVP
jgi:hypothetical protein